MANQKILEGKQTVIAEIKEKVKNASAIVFFDYRGLTVTEVTELRKKLRESGSDFKVYKNTLTKRALDELNIKLDEYLSGPNAITFSEDSIAPIKTISEFAKKHTALELKVGIVDGKVSDLEVLKQLATIPSREGLLTMVAGGLLGTIKDLAICLDLYTKKENK